MAELRSLIFLERLQPQTMCYLGSWIRGRLPRAGMAARVIEIAPGLDIESLTDVAVKEADVQAGILVVERQFGYLEMHGTNDAAPRQRAVLAVLGVSAAAATAPQVLASRIITRVDAQHAFLVNRNKLGSMVLPGESLFVLELQPASYAILAANEAEKAAQIKIVDYRMIGATGRACRARRDVRRPPTPSQPSPVCRDDRPQRGVASLRRSARLIRDVFRDLLPAVIEHGAGRVAAFEAAARAPDARPATRRKAFRHGCLASRPPRAPPAPLSGRRAVAARRSAAVRRAVAVRWAVAVRRPPGPAPPAGPAGDRRGPRLRSRSSAGRQTRPAVATCWPGA